MICFLGNMAEVIINAPQRRAANPRVETEVLGGIVTYNSKAMQIDLVNKIEMKGKL